MKHSEYKAEVMERFRMYRSKRFRGKDDLFDPRRPHVFKSRYSCHNLFSPELMCLVSKPQLWFRSMGSSQSLAVSVLGTMMKRGDLSLLAKVPDEHGQPLHSDLELAGQPVFEYEVCTLGEPRPTQVDLFLPRRGGNVAIECKFWEGGLSPCSQVRKVCNGDYASQPRRQRGQRCALTEKGIKYWDYIPRLFNWPADQDHRPCPIRRPYQLVRNVLAAAIDPTTGDIQPGWVAILLCDANNPATTPGGKIDEQYRAVQAKLQEAAGLKRATWQALAGVLKERGRYDDLLAWLFEKYGIKP